MISDKKILIIGSSGQLGSTLISNYPDARSTDQKSLDISNEDMVNSYDWSGIEVIINAAAYTNVDGAETPEGRILSWKINASGPAYLSKVATKHGITLIHVSTDYVFDGSHSIHDENEEFSPLGVYGQTKAAGDIAVSTTQKHYILRTSWLIGDGPNFVKTMIGLANKNISPKVVSDQIGRLTFTETLVEAIDYLLSNNCDFGTYNLSNSGEPASWANITRKIFATLNRSDLEVAETTTDEYFSSKTGIAPRPLNSVFSLDKIKSVGYKISPWQEELVNYVKREKNL